MAREPVHLLTIGDELLTGDIVDGNKALLGRFCRQIGLSVVSSSSVPDAIDAIVDALAAAACAAKFVFVTGGLGPTRDDLTVEAFGRWAGVELQDDPQLRATLLERFPGASSARSALELRLAQLPRGARPLDNPLAVTPGFTWTRAPAPGRAGLSFFVFPGAPDQLEAMLATSGFTSRLASLRSTGANTRRDSSGGEEPSRIDARGTAQPVSRVRVIDWSEADLVELLAGWRADSASITTADGEGFDPLHLSLRADPPYVDLCASIVTPTQRDPNSSSAERIVDAPGVSTLALERARAWVAGLRVRLVEHRPHHVVVPESSVDPSDELDDALEPARRVQAQLRRMGCTVVTAESCTAGLIGATLAACAGASDVFRGGVIAYANDVKMSALDVGRRALVEHGAVSAPVVAAMARGALQRLSSDFAISVSGIAGPGGATPTKPVGTVFIGIAFEWAAAENRQLQHQVVALWRRLALSGDRDLVRASSVAWALELLARVLCFVESHRPTPSPGPSAPALPIAALLEAAGLLCETESEAVGLRFHGVEVAKSARSAPDSSLGSKPN